MTTLGRFQTTHPSHKLRAGGCPFGGPAGMLPPKVPEDADHQHLAIDGNPDPIPDLPQQLLPRLPTRHGKAIPPLELVRSEPTALLGHPQPHELQVLSCSRSWIRFPSGSFKVAIRRLS